MCPSYDFTCEKCDQPFTVIRSIKEPTVNEPCPDCGNIGQRVWGLPLVIGAAVESAEYNPAFGRVVKNSKERKELAKQRGWVEVGSEKPDTIHKESAKTQAHNYAKKWSDD